MFLIHYYIMNIYDDLIYITYLYITNYRNIIDYMMDEMSLYIYWMQTFIYFIIYCVVFIFTEIHCITLKGRSQR